jgi:uncharacterized protein
MRLTLTGATGLIGSALVERLQAQGTEITLLSRDPSRASARLGVEAIGWDPVAGPPPVEALLGRDAVVHLAGEPVAQRWTTAAKRAIRDSRVLGTRHLVAALMECGSGHDSGGSPREGRPKALVSASAIGFYGPHAEEPLDEEAAAGSDFLAGVCVAWEQEARKAEALGMRAVQVRTGVVLDRRGGALAKMLPPFRLGLGGPVAGGRQYVSWIGVDDLVGIVLAALADERWTGPINATAPTPVTNHELSLALGRALHRPALLPVPAFALRALYGEMAAIVVEGARVLPVKPLMLGYEFRRPLLPDALAAALSQPADAGPAVNAR